MSDRGSVAPAFIDVVWLGHASTDIRLGGARFVTDPVLRDHVGHLRRHDGARSLAPGPVDAVLLSHLHHDHLDLPSIRRLPPGTPLVVPRGSGKLVARSAPGDVIELGPGQEAHIGGVRVTAVAAEHGWGRTFRRVKSPPLGFVLEAGDRVVYFAGDTDLHPMMADLPAPDVALLPIWGWGPTLGPGHLDPDRAAQAASLLRARLVVPVHWGTFAPRHLARGAPAWLGRPAGEFTTAMARHAPDTELRLVRPGPTSVFANPIL